MRLRVKEPRIEFTIPDRNVHGYIDHYPLAQRQFTLTYFQKLDGETVVMAEPARHFETREEALAWVLEYTK